MAQPALNDLASYGGQYVTPKQLADYFGVAHDTVNKWIRTGKLQACKPGGYDWRIPIDQARALEAILYVPREKSA